MAQQAKQTKGWDRRVCAISPARNQQETNLTRVAAYKSRYPGGLTCGDGFSWNPDTVLLLP